MKKIALALVLIASMQIAGAQSKSASAVTKAVDAAKVATENPKKAVKADTWVKLGKAYLDAYTAAQGSGMIGLDKTQTTLMMGSEKPKSSETVTIEGQQYTKDVYATCNYYFNANNQLAMIEITKPIIDGALDEALVAYKTAAHQSDAAKKAKDISAAIEDIASKFQSEAYTRYTFADYAAAASLFEKAAQTSATAPLEKVDTNSYYNAGFIYAQAGDNASAKRMFNICLNEINYAGTDGDIYARLADLSEKDGDKEAQKKYLEDGFAAYPQSQMILIGLINYYVTNHEDTGRLFALIDAAKANEPNNASLYYVEGNIYKELGDQQKAIEAYEQCAVINPEYEYGYIGEGIMLYSDAIDIQEKAQSELDDAKYMALVADFEKALKGCIEPFEKAFNITKDESLKVSISEYLKNACYRFREDGEEFQTKYDKYSAIVSGQ